MSEGEEVGGSFQPLLGLTPVFLRTVLGFEGFAFGFLP